MHKLYEWNEMLCKGLKEEMECFEKDPNPEKLHEIKEIVETIVGLTELEAAGAMREYFEDEHGYDSRTGQFPDRDWTAPHRIWNAAPMRTMPPYYPQGMDYDMMPDMDYDGVYNRAYPPIVRRGVNDRGRSRDSRGRYNEGYGIYNMAHPKEKIKKMSDHDYDKWLEDMIGADGSKGPMWTEEQTTAIAKKIGVDFKKFTPKEFQVAMDMMYSDMCEVGAELDIDKPEFYALLAKNWLLDDDTLQGGEKLSAYHEYVVDND